MKKRLMALVCMLTCIFGLTACGSGEELTAYEQQKVDNAEQLATSIVPLFTDYLCNAEEFTSADLTNEEIEYLCEQYFGLQVDGYAVTTAIESFSSALESMGSVVNVGEADSKIDGKQIIVNVDVTGEKKNASAEIIFSNDMFLKLESAALNPVSSMGELMGRAALNTLIGMGTVFLVLILISFIISAMQFIPKLQEAMANRKKEKKAVPETVAAAPVAAQPVVQETVAETDDCELVAAIAAAIAAYRGETSTDGFVVRSIRRR